MLIDMNNTHTYHRNYNSEVFAPAQTGVLTALVPQKRGDDYSIRINATNVETLADGSISYTEVVLVEVSRGEYEQRLSISKVVKSELVTAYKWQFTSVLADADLSINFVPRHDWTSTISECN
jgi:hypothetical protein